jgi:hypothetical protein
VAKVIESTIFAIALSGSVNQGEIAGPCLTLEAAFDRGRERFRVSGADKAAGGDRDTILNEGHGFICRAKEPGESSRVVGHKHPQESVRVIRSWYAFSTGGFNSSSSGIERVFFVRGVNFA